MLLPLPPTILLAAAGLALIAGRLLSRQSAMIWGWCFLIAMLAAAGGAVSDLATPSINPAAVDFQRYWTNDGLAISQQWVLLLFGLVLGLPMCTSVFRQHRNSQVYGFCLFAISGLMLVARSNDLLSAAMSLEILTISLIALQRCFVPVQADGAALRDEASSGAEGNGLHSWVPWMLSGSMWLAIALFLNGVMTTHFDAVRLVLVNSSRGEGIHSAGGPSRLILLGAGLMLFSLLGRMTLPLFADGFAAGSTRPSQLSWGFVVVAGQLAGSVLLSRLCGRVFASLGQQLVVLLTVACFTFFFLSIVMTARGFSPGIKSIPRWLISLCLLQNGWLGVGLMTVSIELDHPDVRWGQFPEQIETLGVLVIAQLSSVLAFAGIFGSLDYLSRTDRDVEFLEDVKGQAHVTPWIVIAFAISLASVIGTPWTAGFWSHWLLMLSGHNIHIKSSSSVFVPNEGIRIVVVMGTVATLFAISAVVRLIRELFFESPLARPRVTASRISFIAACAVALFTLWIGLMPGVVIHSLNVVEAPLPSEPQSRPHGLGRNPSVLRSN